MRLLPSHRTIHALTLLAAWSICVITVVSTAKSDENQLSYNIDLTKAHTGFDGKTCWVHARAGAIPAGEPGNPSELPLVIMTTQKLELTGSDVFHPLHVLQTSDMGAHWTKPKVQTVLSRQKYSASNLTPGSQGFEKLLKPGDETVVSDFTPQWHAASEKLLGIGHTVWYRKNRVFEPRPRHTAYAIWNAETGGWDDWKILELPPELEFISASGAGSIQRYDLPNGDILVPVYGARPEERHTKVVVIRCRFDGETLTCLDHGNALEVPTDRGVGEPSLTKFKGRYYLTLRHDKRGYICTSDDGLNFSDPQEWTFDDGSPLGNYNTQQHWVTHSDGLFLVYTRRGAENDHVFRHRAPLFMAQVDPEKLCVIRDTEKTLVPNRGARLGNFGIVDVTPTETWVIVSEWMQPVGVEKYGSSNDIFVAKILWDKPNELFNSSTPDSHQ